MIKFDFSNLKTVFETLKGTLLGFTIIWFIFIVVMAWIKIMIDIDHFWFNILINVVLIAVALVAQRAIKFQK